MGDHFGKLGAVRSFWFCREDQPGLGLGLRSHNSGGTVFSLKKFFPPTPNQFVGVSASRTFLSPFTKGTRVLALVIRFLHFCAHSMGIHYTKQTSTSPHLHSLPISANFTLISTKSGFSDTFSPPPPPPPGCVCVCVRGWGCVCGTFPWHVSVCVVPIFAQPQPKILHAGGGASQKYTFFRLQFKSRGPAQRF